MVGRDDGKYVLYPLYFDAKAARPPRRVALASAVHSPTAEEVARAAQKVGLAATIEKARHHPARWWKREGRVLVEAVGSKDAMVRQVAGQLRAARDALGAADQAPEAVTTRPAAGKPKGKAKQKAGARKK